MLPEIWKESFDSGLNIPLKMRFCNECNVKKLCDKCNNRINENKQLEANFNELKRHRPNEFGVMLPYFLFWNDFVCNKVSKY